MQSGALTDFLKTVSESGCVAGRGRHSTPGMNTILRTLLFAGAIVSFSMPARADMIEIEEPRKGDLVLLQGGAEGGARAGVIVSSDSELSRVIEEPRNEDTWIAVGLEGAIQVWLYLPLGLEGRVFVSGINDLVRIGAEAHLSVFTAGVGGFAAVAPFSQLDWDAQPYLIGRVRAVKGFMPDLYPSHLETGGGFGVRFDHNEGRYTFIEATAMNFHDGKCTTVFTGGSPCSTGMIFITLGFGTSSPVLGN